MHLNEESTLGNVEARARAGRYEALAELCTEHGIEDLLLAHHQNDQAETVLLQLLRGAGVAGLAAMSEVRELRSGNKVIQLWRPLINQSKAELEAYAKANKLKWIEDPSNQNTQYRRNAIRKKIIPLLEKIQPDAVASLARSAKVLADAQTLLDRLALQDGNGVLEQDGLKVNPLLALAKKDLPAANNLVRFWLKSHGLAMPSQERLASWWKDLSAVKIDANLEWLHDELKIRLWRGMLQVSEVKTGEWTFQKVSIRSKNPGLPAKWVQEAQKNGQISLKPRAGSEKIQIKPNTPRRSLKNLFQEADIPPWQRQAPLLFINGELIAVAGIGISYPHLIQVGPRLMPEWG